MPVTHDLTQDLHWSKEDIQLRRAKDPRLNTLFDKYADIDKAVLEAEAGASLDDELKKLKERRLSIKDQILEKLQRPS
ncbi:MULTISPECIES: YdcH family protein [Pseudomonas]|uniref:DUF465 domain-containing protein n=1 Tax=Pseudomonas fluorescens (strain Q2-87) TaxID=1038922 RepID=J2MTH9_PSEFQ|nr:MULTISPECIES: YdcH family protein [Pseudomonas]EJL04387.1 hypothetical protein PflQ2_3348 [Pseudomonas fluorescens Q2-87]